MDSTGNHKVRDHNVNTDTDTISDTRNTGTGTKRTFRAINEDIESNDISAIVEQEETRLEKRKVEYRQYHPSSIPSVTLPQHETNSLLLHKMTYGMALMTNTNAVKTEEEISKTDHHAVLSEAKTYTYHAESYHKTCELVHKKYEIENKKGEIEKKKAEIQKKKNQIEFILEDSISQLDELANELIKLKHELEFAELQNEFRELKIEILEFKNHHNELQTKHDNVLDTTFDKLETKLNKKLIKIEEKLDTLLESFPNNNSDDIEIYINLCRRGCVSLEYGIVPLYNDPHSACSSDPTLRYVTGMYLSVPPEFNYNFINGSAKIFVPPHYENTFLSIEEVYYKEFAVIGDTDIGKTFFTYYLIYRYCEKERIENTPYTFTILNFDRHKDTLGSRPFYSDHKKHSSPKTHILICDSCFIAVSDPLARHLNPSTYYRRITLTSDNDRHKLSFKYSSATLISFPPLSYAVVAGVANCPVNDTIVDPLCTYIQHLLYDGHLTSLKRLPRITLSEVDKDFLFNISDDLKRNASSYQYILDPNGTKAVEYIFKHIRAQRLYDIPVELPPHPLTFPSTPHFMTRFTEEGKEKPDKYVYTNPGDRFQLDKSKVDIDDIITQLWDCYLNNIFPSHSKTTITDCLTSLLKYDWLIKILQRYYNVKNVSLTFEELFLLSKPLQHCFMNICYVPRVPGSRNFEPTLLESVLFITSKQERFPRNPTDDVPDNTGIFEEVRYDRSLLYCHYVAVCIRLYTPYQSPSIICLLTNAISRSGISL